MAFVDSFRNAIVSTATAQGDWYSLHSADPGLTGANEVSVGREQMVFPAPSAGSSQGSEVPIAMVSGTQCSHFGVWTAETAGTFKRGGPLPATSVFGADGVYNLSDQVVCPSS